MGWVASLRMTWGPGSTADYQTFHSTEYSQYLLYSRLSLSILTFSDLFTPNSLPSGKTEANACEIPQGLAILGRSSSSRRTCWSCKRCCRLLSCSSLRQWPPFVLSSTCDQA